MKSAKSSAYAIRLDPRRLEQLKMLAAALGVSNATAIGHLLREKIEAGVIPAGIPGVSVTSAAKGVCIGIDDAEPVTYSRDVAAEIAETLEAVGNGGPGVVNMDDNFAVVRQGVGIKVVLPLSGPTAKPFQFAPSFPPDLVQDLAALIRKAVA